MLYILASTTSASIPLPMAVDAPRRTAPVSRQPQSKRIKTKHSLTYEHPALGTAEAHTLIPAHLEPQPPILPNLPSLAALEPDAQALDRSSPSEGSKSHKIGKQPPPILNEHSCHTSPPDPLQSQPTCCPASPPSTDHTVADVPNIVQVSKPTPSSQKPPYRQVIQRKRRRVQRLLRDDIPQTQQHDITR